MTVCVQWSRFGPYHLARLRAAHAHLQPLGADLVALETATADAVYDWRTERAAEPFRRVQVFPGSTAEEVPARRVVTGTWRALDRIDPGVVAINSYSAPDAQAALLWCRRRRRIAVCMMESTAGDAARAPAREWVKRQVVGAFDAALAGGSAQRDYLVQLGFPAEAIATGYDVVDNAFFREGAERARRDPGQARHLPGLADPAPFFLVSGRLVARKNIALLIDAYGRYRASAVRPWRLVVLGDGPERSALERRAAGTDGVTFAGFRQYEDLPAYYGLAGAFVHPALVEPWGLVVNEAMAAGAVAVVSDRVGSARDLIRNGETGFTVDASDVAALAARLAEVAALPEADRQRVASAGQRHVAGWDPKAFGEGLWTAAQAGRPRADRGPSPVLVAVLQAMWWGAGAVRRSYAVPE